jgi:tetratricopeptide (TPR) repeat protein
MAFFIPARLIHLFATMLILMSGCVTREQRELSGFLDLMCRRESMVGDISEAKVSAEGKLQDRGVQAKLGVERTSRLAQELNDYTAQWQAFHQESRDACKEWAYCEYKNRSLEPGLREEACDQAKATREKRQRDAMGLEQRMKALEKEINEAASARNEQSKATHRNTEELKKDIALVKDVVQALAKEDPVIGNLQQELILAFNEEDEAKAESLFDQLAERAFDHAQKEQSDANSKRRYEAAMLQLLIGDVKFQSFAYQAAFKYYRRANELVPKENEGRQPLWDMVEADMLLPRLISSSMILAETEEAESAIDRASRVADKKKSSPEIIAELHLRRGELYSLMGEPSAAASQYQKALAIAETRVGPEHPLMLSVGLHLAETDVVRGEYEAANLRYRHALAVEERRTSGAGNSAIANILVGSASSQIAQAHSLLASDRSQQKESQVEQYYATAEAFLERAIKYAEADKSVGSRNPSVGNALAILGSVCRDQGRLVEAEAYLNLARARLENVLGTEHPLVAGVLARLAVVYTDQERFAQAERNYKEARTIGEKMLGKNHPGMAEVAMAYAALLKRINAQARAKELQLQADAILRKHPDVKIPPVPPYPHLQQREEIAQRPEEIDHQLKRAYIDYAESRFAEAEVSIQRVVVHLESHRGGNEPQIATTLYSLASIYRADTRFTQAEALLEHASKLAEQEATSRDRVVGQIRGELGNMFLFLKRYSEAEVNFRQAIDALNRVRGFQFMTSYMANSLGNVYYKQKRYGEAESAYKEALAVYKKDGEREDENAAAPHHNLGRIYFHQKRYGEALVEIERALALRNDSANRDSRSTVETLRLFADTLEYLNRKAEAASYRERADELATKQDAGENPASTIGR